VSTTRRPLGTGPRPIAEDQPRTDGRRTAVERAAAVEAPDSWLPETTTGPAPSGRRILGTGSRLTG
jgi:hypothetical protein